MLRSELHIIEAFIGRYVYPSGEVAVVTNEQLGELFAEISVQFRAAILQQFFGGHRDASLIRYIRFHQAGLIRLANDISTFYGSDGEGVNGPAQIIGEGLDALMDHLEISYQKYIDKDISLSDYAMRHLEQTVIEDTSTFFDNTENPQETALLTAVTCSLAQLVENAGPGGLSFRQRESIIQAIQTVRICRDIESDDRAGRIFLLLYRQNFNCPAFVNWFKNRVEATHHSKAGPPELRAGELCRRLTETGMNPVPSIDPAFPPVNETLLTWLIDRAGLQDKPAEKGNTVPLNCSVPQLALFTRLLYQTGSFPVTNISDLFRFFSRNFTTKKQEHISIKSFRKAFYSSEQSTAAVVLDILKRMTVQVETLYFPK
ncbi:hypothetical protein D0C36_22645 [Mucilaginibacter conchicola]|uniref:Uncharacterized protein n=1 Tax=Mucilaginibacter conchicola TaxID=2303333 RepID=A0A372NN55_9SPHI|nr:hypothetical protein [Mucilaginibacter conchicola]RFZ90047.1 hypothetical protein D0C36_22645 [Mucilaginibacter conchicola]